MPASQTIIILTVLCLCVAVADTLARYPWGRTFGAPVLALLLAALLANTGLLPAGSAAPPVYAGIFVVVAPMAIFYLLLDASLLQFRRSVLPMLIAFLLGVAGTLLGIVVAGTLVLPHSPLASHGDAIAAAFAANLVGGGAEFDRMVRLTGLAEQSALHHAALAVNAVVASAWVVACSVLPALLQRMPRYRHGAWIGGHAHARQARSEHHRAHEQLSSLGAFALLLALGLAAYAGAEGAATLLAAWGLPLPSILLIGLLALVLAHTGVPTRLPGSKALGRFGVCLFLAVLGAHAELAPVLAAGVEAKVMLATLAVVLVAHLLVLGIAGSGLRVDPDALAVASQAGIGVASTAMAVAESRQRHDLALPAIVAGSVGNAIGVYAGLLALKALGGVLAA